MQPRGLLLRGMVRVKRRGDETVDEDKKKWLHTRQRESESELKTVFATAEKRKKCLQDLLPSFQKVVADKRAVESK